MTEHNPDVAIVESLARILHEQKLGEIEYTRRRGKLDDVRIRVSALNHAPSPPPSAAALATASSESEAAETDEARTTVPELASHPGAVTAPMVGTIYLQPEPDADPFIEIGQTVATGDTLFIIEAMKTMNHIPAPHAGTVRRILVENKSIVEFGSPLAIID